MPEPESADNSKAMLVAMELIRRAIADLPQAFARNVAMSEGSREPEFQPTNPANPAVVVTPEGPRVDPRKVLSPPGDPGPTGTAPKSHQDLARMQADAARDLANAAKSQKAQATAPGASRGIAGAIGGMAQGITGAMATAVGKILPPLAILSGILGSANSGFTLVTKTFQLLYAVLAPVLLPVLFLFAAGMLYVSDLVMKHLWPAFKKLWQVIGPPLVKAFEVLASVVQALANAITWVLDKLGIVKDPNRKEEPPQKSETAAAVADTIKGAWHAISGPVAPVKERTKKEIEDADRARGIDPAKQRKLNEERVNQLLADLRDEEEAKRPSVRKIFPHLYSTAAEDRASEAFGQANAAVSDAVAKAIGPKATGGLLGAMQRQSGKEVSKPSVAGDKPTFRQAMVDMLKAFSMSLGPRAEFGDLGASQLEKAQLAALNIDPIEERMLRANLMAVDLLQELVANTEPDRGTFGAKE